MLCYEFLSPKAGFNALVNDIFFLLESYFYKGFFFNYLVILDDDPDLANKTFWFTTISFMKL